MKSEVEVKQLLSLFDNDCKDRAEEVDTLHYMQRKVAGRLLSKISEVLVSFELQTLVVDRGIFSVYAPYIEYNEDGEEVKRGECRISKVHCGYGNDVIPFGEVWFEGYDVVDRLDGKTYVVYNDSILIKSNFDLLLSVYTLVMDVLRDKFLPPYGIISNQEEFEDIEL